MRFALTLSHGERGLFQYTNDEWDLKRPEPNIPANAVGERAVVVGVEVHGVDFAAVEVVDHGAVAEVVGYPAAFWEFYALVVHVVQQADI